MENKRLNDYVDEVHDWAKEKGWHETPRTFGEYIALMHSELSEALEEYRNGHHPDDTYYRHKVGGRPDTILPRMKHEWHDGTVTIGKPEGIPTELADVIIRIFDFCGLLDIDLEQVLDEKMEYNYSRDHRHGGKVI